MDFLLSKASEYSNFIAKDLDELQSSMTEQAQRAMQKAEKKRSKEEMKTGNSSKKQKANGGQATKIQQQSATEMMKNVGTTKPIFIQPPNLSTDCVLKDYQLEGVRWLASLFENGVSGILADGMFSLKSLFIVYFEI